MPPNVLLVVLDSVRARNVQFLGHRRETMPFLSKFAEQATTYTQARSGGTRSITGHASLFTGAHVEEHELTTADRTLSSGSTIFETLRGEGYETGVFSENVWITELEIGLERGFDTVVGPQNVPFPSALDARQFVAAKGRGNYRQFMRESLKDDSPIKSLTNGVATKLSSDYPNLYPFDASAPGDVYVDRFLQWHEDREGPWAACLNLMDAHGPYEPEPSHNLWGDETLLSIQERKPNNWELLSEPNSWWMLSAVESLYDGAIHQIDSIIEGLINTLEERGELEDTLVVITSDHGEGFGEPSNVRPGIQVAGHNTSLHEVILHVPLVVKFPGQQDGSLVTELSSLTQFPTVVERELRGGASVEDFCVERTFATSYALLVDEQLRSRARRFQDPDSLEGFQDRLRAVYEQDNNCLRKIITFGNEKATRVTIRDAQVSYVDGEADPGEVDSRFEALEDGDMVTEGSGMEDVDDATKQRLEDLGYM